MSITKDINGVTHRIPELGNSGWGNYTTQMLTALIDASLFTGSGDSKPLTSDLDLGDTHGLIVNYIKSNSSNLPTTGKIRLANGDIISWRNAANDANIEIKVDSNNRLVIGGVTVPTISSPDSLINKTIDADNNTISNLEVDNLKSGVLDTDLSSVSASDDTLPSAKATKTALDLKLPTSYLDTDGTLAANSDVKIASQKATKTYVDTVSGSVNSALTNHLLDTVDAHDASAISSVASGNLAATDVQAALNELQSDIDTRIAGPASATDNALARFDGTTGKIAQDYTATPVTASDAGVLTVNNATDSSSKDTGAVIVEGGVGIEKKLYVGTDIVAGTSVSAPTVAVSTALTVEDPGAGTNKITVNAPTLAGDWTLTLPTSNGSPGQYLKTDGDGITSWDTPTGAGDVSGPASSVDNAIVRFDGTTGKLIQDYTSNAPTISDVGVLTLNATPLIDTIDEKTSTNGVQLKGRSSASAVSAGYIGEELAAVTSSPVTMNTSVKYLSCAINLTAGNWLVYMHVQGAKGNASVIEGGISTSNSAFDTSSNPYSCDRGPHRGFAAAFQAIESSQYGLTASRYFRVSSTTAIYALMSQNGTTGTGTAYLWAVRLP